MTDAELIKAAALAAGYTFYDDTDMLIDECGDVASFDPLRDDADAFRLGVKLNLQIIIEDERCGCVTASWGEEYQNHAVEHSETPETAAAATRRAIVRAAAAIGEKMGAPLVRAEEG